MFRSTTIIRELASELAKGILILKHSARLRRNLLCGGAAACPGVACVSCAVQSRTKSRCAQHTRNFAECFNMNISLASSIASSLTMVVYRNV